MLTARPLLDWALGPGQFGAIARGALPSRVGEKLLNRQAASARGVGVHQSGSNGVPSPPQVRRPSAPLLRSGPSTAEVACSRRSPPQVRAPFPGSPVGSSRIRPATRRRTRPSSETHNLRAASRPRGEDHLVVPDIAPASPALAMWFRAFQRKDSPAGFGPATLSTKF